MRVTSNLDELQGYVTQHGCNGYHGDQRGDRLGVASPAMEKPAYRQSGVRVYDQRTMWAAVFDCLLNREKLHLIIGLAIQPAREHFAIEQGRPPGWTGVTRTRSICVCGIAWSIHDP